MIVTVRSISSGGALRRSGGKMLLLPFSRHENKYLRSMTRWAMSQVLVPKDVAAFLKSGAFSKLPRVTASQVSFASQMGINIAGFPAGVAEDILQEAVTRTFGKEDKREPTEKQLATLQRQGLDGTGLERYLVGSLIHHILLVADLNAIDEYGFKAGMKVMHSYDGSAYEISSVRSDGTVFFKGGNGKKACARNLRPYVKTEADGLRKARLEQFIEKTGMSISVKPRPIGRASD